MDLQFRSGVGGEQLSVIGGKAGKLVVIRYSLFGPSAVFHSCLFEFFVVEPYREAFYPAVVWDRMRSPAGSPCYGILINCCVSQPH
jgi:hypothetical protein